jgi:predicted branched-subunit amino acid permease
MEKERWQPSAQGPIAAKHLVAGSAVPALVVEAPTPSSWRASFLAGLHACVPLALSIVPFMTVYGVAARAAGVPFWFAQLLSVAIFARTQLAAVQLLAAGAPGIVAALTAALMNARYIVYSMTLAPQFRHLAWYWRVLAGYFITDETYATLATRLQQRQEAHPQWFLFGGGGLIWLASQSGTALGGWLGQTLPADWSLDFTGTLVFLALLVLLSFTHRAALVTAGTAGSLAVVLADLPWRLGLVVAIVAGLAAGLLAQRWHSASASAEGGA